MRLLLLAVVWVGSGCATVSTVTRGESPRLRGLPEQTELREYQILGSSSAELRAQLDISGPTGPDGDRHDAYTHWFVKWSYPFVRTEGECSTGKVTVTTTVTMDLPRWANADSGSDELKVKWQAYLDSLLAHEAGHRDTALKAASEIADTLTRLVSQATCEEVDRIANEEGQKVLARFRQADVEYDATTQHGATQGARFP